MIGMMDATRRRRGAYRRAYTLSALPDDNIPEVENELDEEVAHFSECAKLLKTNPPPEITGDSRSSENSPQRCGSSQGRRKKERSDKHSDRHNSDTTHDVTEPRTKHESHRHTTRTDKRRTTKKKTDISCSENVSVNVSSVGQERSAMFQKRRSITISNDEPLLPNYESGTRSPFSRSPTSPASILSRVKERIQHSIFLSSESQAAAILHQRRERANEFMKKAMRQKDMQFESMRLAEMSKRRKRRHRKGVGGINESDDISSDEELKCLKPDIVSDPVVYSHHRQEPGSPSHNDDTLSPETERAYSIAAKEAFRRRSVSEDIHDRLPPTFIIERHAITAAASACIDSNMSSKSSSGIICSDEDLHFILSAFKHEKKPLLYPEKQSASSQVNEKRSMLSSPLKEPITVQLTGVQHDSEALTVHCEQHGNPDVIPTPNITPNIVEKPKHGETDLLTQAPQVETEVINQDETDQTQSPPEIVFDEHGQTWDIYGAEFDPEILGEAIQKHLEKLMSHINDKQSSKRILSPSTAENQQNNKNLMNKQTESERSTWWRMLCPLSLLRKEPQIC